MDFVLFLIVAGAGVVGYLASNILLVGGLLGAPFMAAAGWWAARRRGQGRTRLMIGAALHSLFCGLPALYFLISVTGGPVTSGASKFAYVFLFYVWIARIGFMLAPTLEFDLKPAYLDTLQSLSLLAGAIMCVASAGILCYLQSRKTRAPDEDRLLMPTGYLLPFVLAWFFFAGDWMANAYVERAVVDVD